MRLMLWTPAVTCSERPEEADGLQTTASYGWEYNRTGWDT